MNKLIDIHIRWNNGQDLLLTVTTQDTINVIKQLIRKSAVEQTSKKTIRLIHRGQLLKDDNWTLSDYQITEPSIFIHCALSDPIIPTNTISPNKAKEEEEKSKRNTVAGFDKLRESGYNDEEIRSIRTEFHQAHASPNYVDGEPPSEEELQLEEQWIEHSGSSMLPEGKQSNSHYHTGTLTLLL
ncbi:unnamed protein product [Mucor hiemalis]